MRAVPSHDIDDFTLSGKSTKTFDTKENTGNKLNEKRINKKNNNVIGVITNHKLNTKSSQYDSSTRSTNTSSIITNSTHSENFNHIVNLGVNKSNDNNKNKLGISDTTNLNLNYNLSQYD